MAFEAKQLDATLINNNTEYQEGDALQPSAINDMVEGILHNQENNGSGLTEEEKSKLDKIVIDGDGDKYLSDDGTYKQVETGIDITVDSVLSTESENPVQNKTITNALANKQSTLVSGENIKTINGKSILGKGDITIEGTGGSDITVDSELSTESENPVQNKVITEALNGKLELLKGEGKPTTETVGEIGQIYTDTTTGLNYQYNQNPNKPSEKAWYPLLSLASVNATYGIKQTAHVPPFLTIAQANTSYYDARTSEYLAVTLNRLNYAVMKGLTEPLVGKNPVEWTEEEKLKEALKRIWDSREPENYRDACLQTRFGDLNEYVQKLLEIYKGGTPNG